MKIAVISGLEYEVSSLEEMMEDPFDDEVCGIRCVTGDISGHTIFNVFAGAGKVASAMATQAAICEYMPNLVIQIGLAGGCNKDLHPGDAVAASRLVYHDIDPSITSSFHGSRESYNSDPAFKALSIQVLQDMGIRYKEGTVATGDRFVNSNSVREDIVERTGCICVDMSSAAVAEVCHKNGIPLIVVKIISDSADDEANEEYAFTAVKFSELSAGIIRGICTAIRPR